MVFFIRWYFEITNIATIGILSYTFYHEISFSLNHAIQYNELQVSISHSCTILQEWQGKEVSDLFSRPTRFFFFSFFFVLCIFMCPSAAFYNCSCTSSALLLYPCVFSMLWFSFDLVKQALDTKRSNSYKGLHFLHYWELSLAVGTE